MRLYIYIYICKLYINTYATIYDYIHISNAGLPEAGAVPPVNRVVRDPQTI